MSTSPVLPNTLPSYDRPAVDHPNDKATLYGVVAIAVLGILFAFANVWHDIDLSGVQAGSFLVYLLLGIALVIALGFEFVNGFHDTANAVATVNLYPFDDPPTYAVVWSGMSGTSVRRAAGRPVRSPSRIVSLLPVELILQVELRRRFCHGVCAA